MTVSVSTPGTRPVRVNGGRLVKQMELLRRIGATPGRGVSRPAFSPMDVRARSFTADLMRQAGLTVRVDAAANLIGSVPGGTAGRGTLALGSHLDTVPDGGAYDGAYGVIAAIEAAWSLRDHDITLGHGVTVVAFCNEEGAPGTAPMFGSRAVVGLVGADELRAPAGDGRPLAEHLDRAGGDSARIEDARWPEGSAAAFFEAHIEQGPVLEREGEQIGVVEAISGRQTVAVTVTGVAGHGGTTPMTLRHDALVGAAHVVLGVRDLAGRPGAVRVATVGECTVRPGAWNVIPGAVRLVVDLRDVRAEVIDAGVARLGELAARIAAGTGTSITVEPMQRVEPTECDPRIRAMTRRAAGLLGLAHRTLPSGAGHDTQWMARVAPSGMIFVPSRAGASHVPGEYTPPADLIAGADVLLDVVVAADHELQ